MVDPKALDMGISKNLIKGGYTVRSYLKALLYTLWDEAERFSSKKPFGSGDWQFCIYATLIRGGFIHGSLDETGYVEELDYIEADKYITELIKVHL